MEKSASSETLAASLILLVMSGFTLWALSKPDQNAIAQKTEQKT